MNAIIPRIWIDRAIYRNEGNHFWFSQGPPGGPPAGPPPPGGPGGPPPPGGPGGPPPPPPPVSKRVGYPVY